MKPIYYCSVLFVMLIATASCERKDCCTVLQVETNTWRHDSVTYQNGSSVWDKRYGRANITFYAAGIWADQPGIVFSFVNKPTVNGKYRVKSNPTAADEMGIMESSEGPGYGSVEKGATAFVTVLDDGKIIVYGEGIPMKQMLFVGGDTTAFFFNLREF